METTMEKTKYTPGPWPDVRYENDTGPDDDGFWEWWEIPGIAKFNREADAEYARLAANSHDALVEALKDIVAGPIYTEGGNSPEQLYSWAGKMRSKACAALRLAGVTE
jgi:hypothetical protein